MTVPAYPPKSYGEALRFLYSRNQFAMKMGLETMFSLLAEMGNPEQSLRFIHVAGTNGKGSVCSALAALLPLSGYRRIGLYTSPHLVSFRERIRVDGFGIPPKQVVEFLKVYWGALQRLNPTYFEIVTGMALWHFSNCKCEVVVLETGLGGRLDATNTVNAEVNVITSISKDHAEILGSTLPEILSEKLGILRPGIPVFADLDIPELQEQFFSTAAKLGSPAQVLPKHGFQKDSEGNFLVALPDQNLRVPPGLRPSEYGYRNMALALLAWHHFAKRISPGWEAALKGSGMVARLQNLEAMNRPDLLLDGAHNPAGLQALASHLNSLPRRPTRILFTMMADKEWQEAISLLLPLAQDFQFADLQEKIPRALSEQQFKEGWIKCLPPVSTEDVKEPGVFKPWDSQGVIPVLDNWPAEGRIVVCGSLYFLGALLPQLWIRYPGLESLRELHLEDEAALAI